MSNGILSLSRSRWHQGSGDLTDQRVTLDRRVLDWAVGALNCMCVYIYRCTIGTTIKLVLDLVYIGLDSEINELVEGSDIYEPRVELSQVDPCEVSKIHYVADNEYKGCVAGWSSGYSVAAMSSICGLHEVYTAHFISTISVISIYMPGSERAAVS